MKVPRSLVILIAILAAAPLRADWVRVASEHFEMYTTSPEDRARTTLASLEQTREFFLNVKTLSIPPELPVIVVAFSSSREYQPYRPKELALGYSTADEQRDYIVMSDLGADRQRIAVHEYVHTLVRHSGLKVPLWLNEGMAEVYSGMEIRDGKVLLGAIAEDRIHALGSSDLMHLPLLFAVDEKSPSYNEASRMSVFYSESCLLTHMLMLSEDYARLFPTFLDHVSRTGAQQALADVYGKSVAEVERDMTVYFRRSSTKGAVFTAPAQREEPMAARPANDVEVDLTLAKLTGMLGRSEEAREKLARIAAGHPGDPEIEEAQAYMAWRGGDREAALRGFGWVFAHGGAHWKTYWDYARLLEITKPDPAAEIDALDKVLELKPDFGDARFMLARELYISGQHGDALAELEKIGEPEPRYAGSMFALMAVLTAQMGRPAQARQYIQKARECELSPEQAKTLDELQARLDKPAAAQDDDEDARKRPTIRRGKPRLAPEP